MNHKAPTNIPPIHQTCLALFNWGSSKKDCNPAWHQIYLAELTTASAGSSYCQIPNVFQGFSSPSTNRTQNKIYSNVTLRHTSELAHVNTLVKVRTCYKCYTNNIKIFPGHCPLSRIQITLSVSQACLLCIQLKSEEGNEVPYQLDPLPCQVSCFKNTPLRLQKSVVLCIRSIKYGRAGTTVTRALRPLSIFCATL